jgi:hypothetical protein
MRVKIEIKKKLEGNHKFSIRGLNGKKNNFNKKIRIRTKLKKNNIP